jgi:hypothetical protein
MNVKSITPKFEDNYHVGYIGFTFTDESIVSEGISYFERWNRLSDIRVSHTFVVTGDDELVEAHIEHGVQRDTISKYFNDPSVHVFFRKPRGWNLMMGGTIAEAAKTKIGCPYATGLIIADAAADTFLGHWLNKIFRQWPARLGGWTFGWSGHFICSELAAYALSHWPQFYGRGILANPLDAIDPQELFDDEIIFDDWIRASGHGPELNVL